MPTIQEQNEARRKEMKKKKDVVAPAPMGLKGWGGMGGQGGGMAEAGQSAMCVSACNTKYPSTSGRKYNACIKDCR